MKPTSRRASRKQDGASNTREQETQKGTPAARRKKKMISYRRPNRDYSSHMTWTQEMNRFLFKSYVKAKSLGKGYKERMKTMWDEKYPEQREVSPKHLASQVRNILKKNPNIATQYETQHQQREIQQQNMEQHHMNEDQDQQNTEQGRNQENNEQQRGQKLESNRTAEIRDDDVTSGEHNFTEQQINEKYQQIKGEIRRKFIKNFNKYKSMNINYREYSTKATPAPDRDNIDGLNEIINKEIGEQLSSLDQWTINVIQYASAVTILEQENRLREIKRRAKRTEKPGWKIRIQSRIVAIRRKISYTYTLQECQKTDKYTKHQLTLKRKMEKQYGKCTAKNLLRIQTELKQDLKIESLKLKRRKKIEERRYINRMFKVSPKTVYRQMKGQAAEKVKKMPTKESLEDFWGGLWGTEIQHNTDAEWSGTLREEYCQNVQETEVNITDEIMSKVLKKLANNKHGRDLITGQWIKLIKPLHNQLK